MSSCPAEPASQAGQTTPTLHTGGQIAPRTAQRRRRRTLLTLGGVATLLVAGFTWAVLPASAAEPNLALNRPVTTSSVETSTYSGAKAVDGNATSRWASAEGHDPEWIRVDLGATSQLSRVVLRWEAAYAKAYRVEVSADGANFQQIYSTTTGNGAVDDLTVTGAGRYVRIYGTQRGTTYGYSLFEIEIFGAGGTPVAHLLPDFPTITEPDGQPHPVAHRLARRPGRAVRQPPLPVREPACSSRPVRSPLWTRRW